MITLKLRGTYMLRPIKGHEWGGACCVRKTGKGGFGGVGGEYAGRFIDERRVVSKRRLSVPWSKKGRRNENVVDRKNSAVALRGQGGRVKIN